jgi:hypothetical protein
MGKIPKVSIFLAALLALSGCSLATADFEYAPEPSATLQPTETSKPSETEEPTPEVVPFWANGLKVQDVTDSTSRSCTFDMCVFIKLTALKNCSGISLYGTSYSQDDNEIDSFDADYPKLSKGKTRVVEFGSDVLDDYEEYVELDEWTCWK